MIQNGQIKKNEKNIIKIDTYSLLSNIFSFVPPKRAYQIIHINKRISILLNINIDDYYLDKKYQKIIHKSKGNINHIFKESYNIYQSSNLKLYENQSELSFSNLTSNIIKYLKYLYLKKEFKTFQIIFEGNMFYNWLYFSFIIEILRNIKCGITIKLRKPINYKYYDILQDAIQNLEEIDSIYFYSFNQFSNDEKFLKYYFNYCDWTKVKCLNFSESKVDYSINKCKNIFIPNNANFRKIVIDNRTFFNLNTLYDLIYRHGKHIEYFKLLYFTDKYFYVTGKNKIKKEIFNNLTNPKKVKFIKIAHLLFFSFLSLFKKCLSSIKVLTLDNIFEYNSENVLYFDKQFNEMINLLKDLKNLEKLEINFNPLSNVINTFKILINLLNFNPNLKDLKITVSVDKKINKENKTKDNNAQKAKNFLAKFVGLKPIPENFEKNEELVQFTNLIKVISSLKELSSLKLNIKMNDKFTKIFNTHFNLGEKLKCLQIIHSRSLNMAQLLKLHPNLNKINFHLVNDEIDNGIKNYEYELSQRSWKSITLNNYPLYDNFINILIKYKNSLNQLTLKDSINMSTKSDKEIYNILKEIRNNIKN